MVKSAIILAGGLGTRLRSVVADVPKCMAPVKDELPFIDILIAFLKREGIEHFIFSLGYKSEIVTDHLDANFPKLSKTYVIEDEPLGTGGAIKKAIQEVKEENVLIINGDTYFNISVKELADLHFAKQAGCSIALKELFQFDRYGSVEINADDRITAFKEKQFCENGYINGGIYLLKKNSFLQQNFDDKFSFEKEYLEKNTNDIAGRVFSNYFIDIGIPEDFSKFKDDYKQHETALNHNNNTPNKKSVLLELIGEILDTFI
jgi:D-glycero-alpha-D-manno-heptose 1-phosphate guanylyltransferase